MNSAKSQVKYKLYQVLHGIRILPSRWELKNPFKVYEFTAMLDDVVLNSSDRILDLGCGKGTQTQLLAKHCNNIVGIDINPNAIKRADRFLALSRMKSRVQYLNGDLFDLQLKPGSFDHIFSFCVLEHIPHYQDILTEVYRLLRPGGQLHLSVDSLSTISDDQLLAKHRADHNVYEYFTLDSLRQSLIESGFEIQKIFPIFTGRFAKEEFS